MNDSTSNRGGKLNSDVYIGLVLIVLSIVAALNTQSFPSAAKRFPLLSCGLLCVLSLILIARGLARSERVEQAGGTIAKLLPWSTTKYALLTFFMTGAYIFLMEHIDFFIATIIFVPAMMIFMRVKKKMVIVLSTAGITLFCWFVFVYQLNIRMP